MLAHVGSAPIEEVALILIPVSALAVALYFANRRADRALRARNAADDPAADDPADDTVTADDA